MEIQNQSSFTWHLMDQQLTGDRGVQYVKVMTWGWYSTITYGHIDAYRPTAASLNHKTSGMDIWRLFSFSWMAAIVFMFCNYECKQQGSILLGQKFVSWLYQAEVHQNTRQVPDLFVPWQAEVWCNHWCASLQSIKPYIQNSDMTGCPLFFDGAHRKCRWFQTVRPSEKPLSDCSSAAVQNHRRRYTNTVFVTCVVCT